MEEQIKKIKKAIALLSSMIYSGEEHSWTSQDAINEAMSSLNQIEHELIKNK